MMKIKAVIFDMNDVLIKAKEWHYEALNKALLLFGYIINRYEHLVTYYGLPRGLHSFINEMKQKYIMKFILSNEDVSKAKSDPEIYEFSKTKQYLVKKVVF